MILDSRRNLHETLSLFQKLPFSPIQRKTDLGKGNLKYKFHVFGIEETVESGTHSKTLGYYLGGIGREVKKLLGGDGRELHFSLRNDGRWKD